MAGAFSSQGRKGYFGAAKSQRTKMTKMDLFGRSGLISARLWAHDYLMELPTQPVTLTVQQIAELNEKLANMRHDVNNKLSLIIAAVDITQYKPQLVERMMVTVNEQPQKIIEAVANFSADFERMFGIKH